MKADNNSANVRDSIIVGGDVSGIVQNVRGDRATAVSDQMSARAHQDDNIQDLIDVVRGLLEVSRRDLENAAEYDEALEVIESGVVNPKQNRFSIKGALHVLSGAATIVTGWADAVTALQHALDKLW